MGKIREISLELAIDLGLVPDPADACDRAENFLVETAQGFYNNDEQNKRYINNAYKQEVERILDKYGSGPRHLALVAFPEDEVYKALDRKNSSPAAL